ncbi:hypothetical protein MATL_G00244540 [Megalops atlanticus]|uniref:RNA ligase 1 n=1 Tax=Megalops atlanticus TaxID=7932 RepID=A0A9D3PAI7_MEGAT|nr:hypothetical protein MATL_G00244540 [Megalops atlanticus]
MRRLGAVQQKMPCVFLTEVREEPSRKRECQQFQVVATESVNPRALQSNIHCALATEKLDGTCCYVSLYKGEPYLWARLDRKPSKQADRRFKQSRKNREEFTWNVEEDFRNVPESWIPAHGVQHCNGQPIPDENGHIPGWVPVERNRLGSKKQPIHLLVSHGSLHIRNAPAVSYQQLAAWFQDCEEGRVEGIVWHCNDGTLVKLHRHHLGLKWPDGDTFLNRRPVVIRVPWESYALDTGGHDLFAAFSNLNGRRFDRVQDVRF